MAFQLDAKIYVKLDPSGETNSYDKWWDDGIGGHIKQILVWHDEYTISGFQTIYERGGECLISKRHGGTQGNFVTINPKKPLTWLSGHYGSYCLEPELFVNEEDDPMSFCKRILSLKFGNEEETCGPFGCMKDIPFFYRGSNEIVGFHGCGEESTTATSRFGYISAIGLYIETGAVGVLGQPSNPNGSVEMIEAEDKKPRLTSRN